MNYITVDSGTTNTRVSLVCGGCIAGTEKFGVGASTAAGGSESLKGAIKQGIDSLLSKNGMTENDIEKILASGMITSEFGLCRVEHVSAPAGIKELHKNLVEKKFDDISPIPFVFVPGVKTDCARLETADMMRGEETELFGFINGGGGDCVYVLPGSHSKITKTDSCGRIADFVTMLTGEMIFALSQSTILKSCVDLSVGETDGEYLLKGYEYCKKSGINEALFKTRILKNMFGCDNIQTYSFFIGAVLCGEIEKIIALKPEKIVIGGRRQIKNATADILKAVTDRQIETIPDDAADALPSRGMINIYEFKMQ